MRVLRYHNRADDRPERSLGPRLPDPAFQLGIVKLLRSFPTHPGGAHRGSERVGFEIKAVDIEVRRASAEFGAA
jgi:hypothetical protein